MSVDLIKKEDLFLGDNNMTITHYEIFGNDDIYFLKIKVKNNKDNEILKFKMKFKSDNNEYTYNSEINVLPNEEKDILDPIGLPLADFEFISFYDVEFKDEVKEEIKEEVIPTKKNNKKLITILSIIVLITSFMMLILRLSLPYISSLSSGRTKLLYNAYGNVNFFKFFFDIGSYLNSTGKGIVASEVTDYKIMYIIKGVFVLASIITTLYLGYQSVLNIKSNNKGEKPVYKNLKLLYMTSFAFLVLGSPSSKDILVIIFTIISLVLIPLIDIVTDLERKTHFVIKKITKEIITVISIITISLLNLNILTHGFTFPQIFVELRVNDAAGIELISGYAVIIMNILMVTYLALFVGVIQDDKVQIEENLIYFVLAFFYIVFIVIFKTSDDSLKSTSLTVSTILIIVLALLGNIAIIIRDVLIKKIVNKNI